jgi:hypothetical protein
MECADLSSLSFVFDSDSANKAARLAYSPSERKLRQGGALQSGVDSPRKISLNRTSTQLLAVESGGPTVATALVAPSGYSDRMLGFPEI